jgi:hypothetical protein
MHRGGEVVGLNPLIRVYRYTKGQFFDCHCKLKVFFVFHRANAEQSVSVKVWYRTSYILTYRI